MKHASLFMVLILCICSLVASCMRVTPDREEPEWSIDLTKEPWILWLDENADWQDDSLFLPPVDIKILPVNRPTCGWDTLEAKTGKEIRIPATVEEHFWKDTGISDLSGDYRGVSWFLTRVFVPEDFRGKRVVLDFESIRLRGEIFVNRELAGYDCIGNTPFEVNIGECIDYGAENVIAVRITDPSGNFSWADYNPHKWGDRDIPPSHGFGGITGRVCMRATGKTYISDIFVRNRTEITVVDIDVVISGENGNVDAENLSLEITDLQTGDRIFHREIALDTVHSKRKISFNIPCPAAKIWSPEFPNLYEVQVGLKGTGPDQLLSCERDDPGR